MARIAGVTIPSNKKVWIALRYIKGIGPKIANDICETVGISEPKRVHELTNEDIVKIREIIDAKYIVETDLDKQVSLNIRKKKDMGCYEGLRHRNRLPVRGQNTHNNARTRKGKAITIANKKK